jgi:hypothetical protein
VYYFISDEGPTQLAPGDTVPGLISQIRLAAKVWNDVGSSDLRVAFGGMSSSATTQNSPGIDVSFDEEIPPGVWALGGVTSIAAPVVSEGTAGFVPITRGTVKIRRDLSESPSFGERAFLTVVHEFGHALGLQHTFTSSVMSTEVTRALTRAKPLAADDIAAISLLYPTGEFLSQTGSLTGRVTADGSGVNLASVVAISPNGPAISTVTNPDGTYAIRGIPPGGYLLYVHPLPPALIGETWPGNVVPAQGPEGGYLLSDSGAFETHFYPGTRDASFASMQYLSAGETKTDIDFFVQRRTAPAVSSVTVYGYYGSTAVKPAPVVNAVTTDGAVRGSALVAIGNGLVTSSNTLVPGLSVRVLGDAGANIPSNSVKYYTSGYIRFDAYSGFGWAPGPRHLLFTTPDDLYVLPAGVLLVSNQGPQISSVSVGTDERGNRAAIISGSNFDSGTRIFFDGVEAPIVERSQDGALVVTPPTAPGGHRANVVALNSDGQSSLFTQPDAGSAYLYDPAEAPLVWVTPSALAAGSETMVEITGVNTSFTSGQTVIGFGTSDIAVRRVWVVAPDRILANVSVAPSAASTSTTLTVATGLRLATIPFGFQIMSASSNPQRSMMVPPVINSATGTAGVWAGGTGVLTVTNLHASAGMLTLTVADAGAEVLSVSGNQVTFRVPAELPVGPAILRLQVQGSDAIAPIVMDISPPPPVIAAVYSNPGVLTDSDNPVRPGSILGVLVTGLPDSLLKQESSRVKVNVGGVEQSAFRVSSDSGGILVQVLLSANAPTGEQVPVTVTYSGVSSAPVSVTVR